MKNEKYFNALTAREIFNDVRKDSLMPKMFFTISLIRTITSVRNLVSDGLMNKDLGKRIVDGLSKMLKLS